MRYIGQYLAAIWGDWVSRMSGLAGLLLIVIAFAFNLTEVGQARYWAAAAVVCFVIASFSAWRTERRRAERLDQLIEGLQQISEQVPLTPADIVKVYKGRTSLAASKLAKAYIGKLMTLNGVVRDVSPENTGLLVALDHVAQGNVSVYLHFDKSATESVSALQKGDSITARGELRAVEPNFVSLDKCELVRF